MPTAMIWGASGGKGASQAAFPFPHPDRRHRRIARAYHESYRGILDI
jgi:hypothetical protein